jgi:hypothetical protein
MPKEAIYMTEPRVTLPPAAEVSGEPEPALERVSAPPILITEQEVAFSTAAALGVRRIRAGHGPAMWLCARLETEQTLIAETQSRGWGGVADFLVLGP